MLFAAAWACSTPSFAAATAFDCDVPADHFSSVSQEVGGAISVSGTVRLVEARSGTHLPVAGARLASPDGSTSVGFQLVAPSADAALFDVRVYSRQGEDRPSVTLAQIPTAAGVAFALSLSAAGKLRLTVGSAEYSADFVPLHEATAMVSCSTAQFKFEGLVFSSGPTGER